MHIFPSANLTDIFFSEAGKKNVQVYGELNDKDIPGKKISKKPLQKIQAIRRYFGLNRYFP